MTKKPVWERAPAPVGLPWNAITRSIVMKAQAADLTTIGHDIHFRACIGCGLDFKFTNSWLCEPCYKKDHERLRRIGHENKLIHANGLKAFK